MLLPSGNNTFKCHEEVLSLQPMIPPKRFDIFSAVCVGCSEGLDAFRFFFKELGTLLTIRWSTSVRNRRVPISVFMGTLATDDRDKELTIWNLCFFGIAGRPGSSEFTS